MPTENARKRARKQIILPSGDQMYVPVITEIDFIDLVGDPSAQAVRWAVGQEFDYSVDNTAQSGRMVHVDQVNPVDVNPDGTPTDPNNPSADTSQNLAVERIDTWPIVSAVERGQEFDFNPDNRTGSDKQPPSFTTHEKTHIYRYYQDPNNPDDGGVWIDSELIDQWGFVDGPNRGQESEFALTNQTNAQFQGGDLSGQADQNDPDITIGGGTDGDGTSGEGTMDIPVRLDPFQNIVNFNGNSFRLVSILIGAFTNDTPVYKARFTTPKTWLSYQQANATHPPLPAPRYNGDVDTPATVSPSADQTVPGPPGLVLTGNNISSAPALTSIDYRGYTTMQGYEWVKSTNDPTIEFTWVATFIGSGDPFMYFDYNGKEIDQIPPIAIAVQRRGAAIASDTNGTIYFKATTNQYGNLGLTKYAADGSIVWGPLPDTDSADTVYVDPKKDPKQIQVSWIFAPDAIANTVGETRWYDLDGNIVQQVVITDDDGSRASSVSRNGQFFSQWNTPSDPGPPVVFDTFSGWKAWSPNGTLLWSFPGESNTVGTDILSMVPYGEEYAVAQTRKSYALIKTGGTPDGSGVAVAGGPAGTSSQKFDEGIRVFNAATGVMVYETLFVSPERITTTQINASNTIKTVTSGDLFGDIRFIANSAYWP